MGNYLDGRPVDGISSALSPTKAGYIEREPVTLIRNFDIAFEGAKLAGEGFIITQQQAAELIAKDEGYKDVVKKYLSGKDVNERIGHTPSRYVIHFRGMPLEQTSAADTEFAERYADAIDIIRNNVKPERDKLPQNTSWNIGLKKKWWQFGLWRPACNCSPGWRKGVASRLGI